jgi:hypothetical protein
MMGRRKTQGFHLQKPDLYPLPGRLPGSLTPGQSPADNGYGFFINIRQKVLSKQK